MRLSTMLRVLEDKTVAAAKAAAPHLAKAKDKSLASTASALRAAAAKLEG